MSPEQSSPGATSRGEGRTTFEARDPRFTLETLILPPDVRERIDSLLGRIQHHETLYAQWGLSKIDPSGRRVAINLHGPPGTGKTSCAEAIARRLKLRIVTVSYADLESKFVGETPKNIELVFAEARRKEAVVFFDEADSILSKRLTSVTDSAGQGVNVSRSTMLLQLDRFEGVCIFATNLIQNYDPAFLRRILGHIELGLPTRELRIQLAGKFLGTGIPLASDATAEWFSDATDGFSGGDMIQVVVGAASKAVVRTGDARVVSQADLVAEIQSIRAAKTAAGLAPPAGRSETLTLDQLPPDVRVKAEASAADDEKPLKRLALRELTSEEQTP